jgi:hypothetical protein
MIPSCAKGVFVSYERIKKKKKLVLLCYIVKEMIKGQGNSQYGQQPSLDPKQQQFCKA